MMLLALHIVAIGSVVGVTAYIAYYLGKKDGLNYAEKEQGKNGNIKNPQNLKKIVILLKILQYYRLSRRARIAAAWENSSSSSAKRIICSPWLCRRSAE